MFWEGLTHIEQIFFIIGGISNVLFLLYVGYQFMGGDDMDMDIDGDVGFALFSFRGITAFGMFLGWTGFLTLRSGNSLFLAIIAGVIAGTIAVWLAYHLIKFLLKFQSSGTLDINRTIGKRGTVYLVIPEKDKGIGKVNIVVQGALRELDAVTDGEAIPTGETILVYGITEGGQLLVKPF